ncbi:MAG: heme-copper oxidase subunit III, partial [Phycisphaerae bacterium]|nr:heme-copper oxidase subunit III [Phycisphaerae bacterium]
MTNTPTTKQLNMLPSGHVGMISLIITEVFFFASLIVVYLAYIGKSISGPLPEEVLGLGLVGVNTVALLLSSATVVVALRALRKNKQTQFLTWLLITVLLGTWFLVG